MGHKNTALNIIDEYEDNFKIVTAVMFDEYYLKDLKTDFLSQYKSVYRKINKFVKQYEPNYLVCERYQNRGRTGLNAEFINIQIGMWVFACRKYVDEVILLTASTWKNQFNREVSYCYDLKDVYVIANDKYNIPNHILDSILMGMYATGREECYTFLTNIKNLHFFLKQIKIAFDE